MLMLPGHNPDPTIIRDGDDYFVVTSTFEYFPALPVYQSKDLLNWDLIGHALDRPSQLNMRTVETGGGIFAPSLRKHKGRYYLACCACYRVPNFESIQKGLVGPRGFYVWTDDIRAGNWSDPVYFDTLGIDQDLFFDDDDRVYLSWATILPRSISGQAFGIGVYGVEIDLESGKAKAKPTLMRHSKHGSSVAEGSHIYKKDGIYYLSTAEGGTEKDHQQWIFKSTQGPLGPWEEPPAGINPILHNGDNKEVQQTGHMDLVQGDDGWYAVFLAIRGGRYAQGGWSQLGRESFITPVDWSGEWPIVNNKRPIGVYGEANKNLKGKEVNHEIAFSPSETLPKGWYHLRTPLSKEWSTTEKPGYLSLYGSPYLVTTDECPAVLLRKQTAFNETCSFELDFQPDEGEEAGIIVWWSRTAYATLSVIGKEEGRALQVKWCEPDSSDFTTDVHSISSSGPLQLKLEAKPTGYTFSTKSDGQWAEKKTVGVGSIVRNGPNDTRNVGTHFGLFAQGTEGWPCLNAAHFKVLEWKSVNE